MKYLLTTFAILISMMIMAQKNTLTVHITNCKNDKGKVMVAIFNNAGSFLKNPLYGKMSEINGKSAKVVFENLPSGTYAISTYHDENSNQNLDTGLFGIPKERYGFSNDAKGNMGPPKYEDAKFEISSSKTIVIKLH